MERDDRDLFDNPLTLVITEQVGRRFRSRKVTTDTTVADALKGIALQNFDNLDNALRRNNSAVYHPDAEQNEGQVLAIPGGEIIDSELIESIEPGAELELVNASQLSGRSIFCYSMMLKDLESGRQLIFMRKASPVQLGTRKLRTRWIIDRLDQIEEPILAFDEYIDAIVAGDTLYALNQTNFERLLRRDEVVIQHVPDWTNRAFVCLVLSAESIEVVNDKAKRDSRFRRKLQFVASSPHSATLDITVFRDGLIELGLDPNEVMPNGELCLFSKNAETVLTVLNEDAFRGPFSGSGYYVQRKLKRAAN